MFHFLSVIGCFVLFFICRSQHIIQNINTEQYRIPGLGKKDSKVKITLIIKYVGKFVFGETFIEYNMNGTSHRYPIYGNCFDEQR